MPSNEDAPPAAIGSGADPDKRDDDAAHPSAKSESPGRSQDENATGDKDKDKAKTQGKDGAEAGADSGDGKMSKPRSKKPLIILAAIVLILAIAAFIAWFAHRNQVSTDDAYTDGNTVTMAPKVSGYVIRLLVDDNAHVHKGDLLVRIDPSDYLAAQSQAQAQLAQARADLNSAQTALSIATVRYPAEYRSAVAQRQSAAAQLAQAQAQYRREHEVDQRATTQQSIDASTSQQLSSSASLKSADAQVAIARLVPEQIEQARDAVAQRQAQLQAAQAQVMQADLNLQYTEIRAPSDGVITMRSVQLGTYLKAGDSMFLLITPEVWVTANFKESQIGRMRVGDRVDLTIDAYSGYQLQGHVQSIQYGSGSRFSAFPAENATGNFVKIVQRIPVKIVIDHGLDPKRELPLGLSVDPVVHFP